MRFVFWAVLTSFSVGTGTATAEQSAAELFDRYKDRIFQVRVIDLEADKKAALGSGFVVGANGLIATNFHVVSEAIRKPDKYRLEYVDEQGEEGDLELLNIDVIGDLALLRAADLSLEPLQLHETAPAQGETIYAIGNPYDIGFTVIPGTYNGVNEDYYYRHIHFSGSLNPGMSGGPTLDNEGRVVGVNVSSAGNQVSFLVPVEELRELVAQTSALSDPVDFKKRIRNQLTDNQYELVGSMLNDEWPAEDLGQAKALAEMKPYVRCWGGSSDEKQLFKSVSSTCRTEGQVFLGGGFTTGVVSYEFIWIEANELSGPRFMSYYNSLFDNFIPDNSATEDDVGNFSCDEQFVNDDGANKEKVVLCIRAYRDYKGLYDALYLSGTVNWRDRALVSHFTLAGVERATLTQFLERFRETVNQ